jgi:dipeptidyl aminopeptidase/acylaminoacyl peptidase
MIKYVTLLFLLFVFYCQNQEAELIYKAKQIITHATSVDHIKHNMVWFNWKPAETYFTYRNYPSNKLGLDRWDEIKLKTREGLILDGWFVPLQNEKVLPKGTLVVLHGSQTDVREALSSCLFLLESGYQLLLFNSRENYPERGYCFLKEDLDDIGNAIDYLKHRGDVDTTRIGVFGFSYGALKAVLAGAKYNILKVVIEDAGPSSFHAFAKYLLLERDREKNIEEVKNNNPDYLNAYKKLLQTPTLLDSFLLEHKRTMEKILGYSIDEYDAIKQASNISPRAILVIHGELDKRVNIQCSKRIFEVSKMPKELFIVPNSEHIKGMHQAEEIYVPKVISFLEEHLN